MIIKNGIFLGFYFTLLLFSLTFFSQPFTERENYKINKISIFKCLIHDTLDGIRRIIKCLVYFSQSMVGTKWFECKRQDIDPFHIQFLFLFKISLVKLNSKKNQNLNRQLTPWDDSNLSPSTRIYHQRSTRVTRTWVFRCASCAHHRIDNSTGSCQEWSQVDRLSEINFKYFFCSSHWLTCRSILLSTFTIRPDWQHDLLEHRRLRTIFSVWRSFYMLNSTCRTSSLLTEAIPSRPLSHPFHYTAARRSANKLVSPTLRMELFDRVSGWQCRCKAFGSQLKMIIILS